MKRLQNIGVGGRIFIIALTALLATVCVTIFEQERGRDSLMDGRKSSIQGQVESVVTLLDYYRTLEIEGKLTTEQAQKQAKDAVAGMRYWGNAYFFILDFQGTMLMHPHAKKLIGTNQMGARDKVGKLFNDEMISKTRQQGAAFVEYHWTKPKQTEPLQKVSYTKAFVPWGWVIGTGVYVDDVDQEYYRNLTYALLFLAVVLVVMSGIVFVTQRSITVPLQTVTSNMLRLAEGHRDIEISKTDAKTEIGDLSRALENFYTTMLQIEDMRNEQEQLKQTAALQRRDAAFQLANRFEASVFAIVEDVSSSASELQNNAEYLSTLSNKMNERSTAVVSATEEASSNVQTVATAAEELSASIAEIGRQVEHATSVSGAAVDAVRTSNEKIEGLAKAVGRISDVVDLITDIADKTNLLALNATIEAARAGDAGKGFAVVASEVKNLANQTGRATEEISNQIGAVQTSTEETVATIEKIGSVIGDINAATSTIAVAVEEQGSATLEISQNVQEASLGTQAVTSNIAEMSDAVSETDTAAQSMLTASNTLQDNATTLRAEVEQFLDQIRSDVDKEVL